MSPKGHLWKTRSIFVSFLATEEWDTSNCMYFGRQIQWCIQSYLWMMFVESGTFFLCQEVRIRNNIKDNVYLSQFIILATEECDTSNCMYFGRQIQWYIQNYLWMMFVESGTIFFSQEGSVRNIIGASYILVNL